MIFACILCTGKSVGGNPGNSGQLVIPDYLKNRVPLRVIKRKSNKIPSGVCSDHYEMIDNRKNCPVIPAVWIYHSCFDKRFEEDFM